MGISKSHSLAYLKLKFDFSNAYILYSAKELSLSELGVQKMQKQFVSSLSVLGILFTIEP